MAVHNLCTDAATAAAQTEITISNPSKRDTGIVQISYVATGGTITAAAALQGRLNANHEWTDIVAWTTSDLTSSANVKVSKIAAVSLFPLMRLNITTLNGTAPKITADLMN